MNNRDILKMYRKLTPELMEVNDKIIANGVCTSEIGCFECPHGRWNSSSHPPSACHGKVLLLEDRWSDKYSNSALYVAVRLKEAYQSRPTVEDINE